MTAASRSWASRAGTARTSTRTHNACADTRPESFGARGRPSRCLSRNTRVVGPLYGHTNLKRMTAMSTPPLTATDVKRHLDLLHEERELSVEIGLASDGAYMADL